MDIYVEGGKDRVEEWKVGGGGWRRGEGEWRDLDEGITNCQSGDGPFFEASDTRVEWRRGEEEKGGESGDDGE